MAVSADLASARAALRAADPIMARLIDAAPDLDPDAFRKALPVEGLFEALLYQIIGQQISVKALDAIFSRLRGLFPTRRPDAASLAGMSLESLRAIGLSGRKAEYVIDLARRVAAGELGRIAELPHDEAREQLVALKGIGPWTADGALLIAHGGPDVLLSGDLVIRKAVQRVYGMPTLPSEQDVRRLGERWRPYRSLAAAYLWRSMERLSGEVSLG